MKRRMFVIIPLIALTITSMVYAAASITTLTQTVTSGDTIQATWYNAVNTMIGGGHTAGGRCTYNGTKILCNSAAPASSSSVNYDCDSVIDSGGRTRSSCINMTNGKTCTIASGNVNYTYNTDWTCFNGSGWDITPADAVGCAMTNYGAESYMKCFNKNGRVCSAQGGNVSGGTIYWTCKASSTGQSVN